jgi:hypothetical protein
MKAAEAIQKITNLLGLQFRAENFASTKLEDGETEVTNNKDEELAIGDILYVVGETTLSPAPMGKHITREGLAIYVDNESYIYKIEDVDTEEEVEEIEDEEVDMLTSATLADGTKIETDTPGEFTVGDEVYVITEDGEREQAPEGEHTTESGITITVDGEGVITGVKYPDEEGEGTLEDMKKEMKRMRQAMSTLLETVTSMNGKTRAEIGELKNEFKKFKKQPDREPVLKKFSTNPSTNLDWKLELVRNSKR